MPAKVCPKAPNRERAGRTAGSIRSAFKVPADKPAMEFLHHGKNILGRTLLLSKVLQSSDIEVLGQDRVVGDQTVGTERGGERGLGTEGRRSSRQGRNGGPGLGRLRRRLGSATCAGQLRRQALGPSVGAGQQGDSGKRKVNAKSPTGIAVALYFLAMSCNM